MFTFTKKWFLLVLLGAAVIAAILYPSVHAKADPDMDPVSWAFLSGDTVCNYFDKAGLTVQSLNKLGLLLMDPQVTDMSPEYAGKAVVYSIHFICPKYETALDRALDQNKRKGYAA